MSRKAKTGILMHFFWYIRNVVRKLWRRQTMLVLQQESWILKKISEQKNLSSEQKTALWSIYSLNVRIRTLSAVCHADLHEYEDPVLMDIYNCLKGTGGEVIELPENVMEGASSCINRMVELGG